MKFILIGSLAAALLTGNCEAIRINNNQTKPQVKQSLHQMSTDTVTENQEGQESEAEMELDAKIAMMTAVTISNTHKSLKMERNHELAKQIALAMKQAIKAEEKAEKATKEAEDETKASDEKKKTKKAEDAAAKEKAAKDKDEDLDADTKADSNSTDLDEGEADEVAASASKAKAEKLATFAKDKVKTIIASYKELDADIQTEMEELEKLLLDTKINANFDPDSAEDIEWVTGEVEKILNATPQLKSLEKKLKMTSDIDDALDSALSGLKKVTNITKMIPKKKEILKKKITDSAKNVTKKKNETASDSDASSSNSTANSTASGKTNSSAKASSDTPAKKTDDAAATKKTDDAAAAKKTDDAAAASSTPAAAAQPQDTTAAVAKSSTPAPTTEAPKKEQDPQKASQVFEFTIGGSENQANQQPPAEASLLRVNKQNVH